MFELDIKANESVFVAFPFFRLLRDGYKKFTTEFIEFEEITPNGTKWKKEGEQTIVPQVYRNSIKMKLQKMKDSTERSVGFKMMFAITPRSQEPQQLSDGKYNCSVANFQDFKSLLHCNHLVECAGEEDEQDCDFHSEQCGHGMIDAGTKCYKLYSMQKEINWYDASAICMEHNMQLVTFATQREQDVLVKLILRLVNFSGSFVGAQPLHLNQSTYISALYNRYMWQWSDGRVAFYTIFINPQMLYVSCGQLILERRDSLSGDYGPGPVVVVTKGVACHQKMEFDILCEKQKAKPGSAQRAKPGSAKLVEIKLKRDLKLARWNVSFVQCPGGHVTRAALSCDVCSDCGVTQMTRICHTDRDLVNVPMFVCQNSKQSVHYSLVCDHIDHCSDKTDEHFCHFPPCPLKFRCRNGQCVSPNKFCDDVVNCLDGTDEKCLQDHHAIFNHFKKPSDQSVVHMVGSGQHMFQPMKDTSDCPATHFLCPFSQCLPEFLRCNGVVDCPGREDEAECEKYTCPGLYRCLGSHACLHPDHVCDGYWQCPRHDDEMLCDPHCPDVCHCQGLAFVCSHRFNTNAFHDLRLLDASGSDMTLTDLGDNPFLIHLNMSRCAVDSVVDLGFPNLIILDLSWNEIINIDIKNLVSLKNLQFLNLASNPLSVVSYRNTYLYPRLKVIDLNLSNISLPIYNGSVFAIFGLLRHLNISNSRVTTITFEGFQSTPLLKSLDMRGSPLTVFPPDVLKHLKGLSSMYVDNFKLCCPVMLPGHFDQDNCHTKYDLLSSCEDLLKSNSYRIFLWNFAFFALMGNISSLISRVYLHTHSSRSSANGFGVFVSNLCLADSLMGVYLLIVGASDIVYAGKYLFHDGEWKKSSTCKFAGALSLMSNEVSAFMISLITLDRLLVICFPFSKMHFKGHSAAVTCVVMWMCGMVIATVPLLPVTSHWEFFSQTGICVPLPFVGKDTFLGYTYSFSIMIVLNFVLFAFIACGQVVIYWSVRASSLDSTNKNSSAREATVARRLITVVVSDFLCWFPVGLLGVLASTGTAIPGEVNVAVAIFVLPLNSALNPFLYTLNVVKERQKKTKEQRLLKQLETRMAVSQIREWLQHDVIVKDDIYPMM